RTRQGSAPLRRSRPRGSPTHTPRGDLSTWRGSRDRGRRSGTGWRSVERIRSGGKAAIVPPRPFRARARLRPAERRPVRSARGYSAAVVDDTRLLGERLRAIRAERGVSLSAVAEATGISTSFLSLVETGKNDITFGRLRRLIDYYGVTL